MVFDENTTELALGLLSDFDVPIGLREAKWSYTTHPSL